jgi:hypothetical protein
MNSEKFRQVYFQHSLPRFLNAILVLLLFCLCTSCAGYYWGHGSTVSKYQTISVPYVEGDWDGTATSAIIQQISQSGILTYKKSGADLILKVKIIDYSDENIGFRYDRKKDGRLSSRIIPDETRVWVLVELTILDAGCGSAFLGPVQIYADVEFDHDYYDSRNGVNVFSLGQLTDIDAARDAAQRPLNRCLAQKIVDYIAAN